VKKHYLTKKPLSAGRCFRWRGGVSVRRTAVLDAMSPCRHRARPDRRPHELRRFFYIPTARSVDTKHGKEMIAGPRSAPREFQTSPFSSRSKAQAPRDLNRQSRTGHLGSVHKYNPATWARGVTPDLKARSSSLRRLPNHCRAHPPQETALPSMEVCAEGETRRSACEAGFGCLYSSTLSYRNANSPLPMEATR